MSSSNQTSMVRQLRVPFQLLSMRALSRHRSGVALLLRSFFGVLLRIKNETTNILNVDVDHSLRFLTIKICASSSRYVPSKYRDRHH